MSTESNDDFAATNLSFIKVISSIFGLNKNTIGTNCALTLGEGKQMKSGDHYRYGFSDTSCSAACTAARTLDANTIEIYNTTGTIFDTTVPAFSTLQGCNTSNNTTAGGTKNNELVNDRYYAIYDGTISSSRVMAQYKSAGSPFWDTTPGNCSC